MLDKEQASLCGLENDTCKQDTFRAVCDEQNAQTQQVSQERLSHVESQNSNNIAVSEFPYYWFILPHWETDNMVYIRFFIVLSSLGLPCVLSYVYMNL